MEQDNTAQYVASQLNQFTEKPEFKKSEVVEKPKRNYKAVILGFVVITLFFAVFLRLFSWKNISEFNFNPQGSSDEIKVDAYVGSWSWVNQEQSLSFSLDIIKKVDSQNLLISYCVVAQDGDLVYCSPEGYSMPVIVEKGRLLVDFTDHQSKVQGKAQITYSSENNTLVWTVLESPDIELFLPVQAVLQNSVSDSSALPKVIEEELIATILSSEFDPATYTDFIEGNSTFCQPEEFKVSEHLYYVEGGESQSVVTEDYEYGLNVFFNEEKTRQLSEPYKLVSLKFSCGDSADYILDIRKARASMDYILLEGNRERVISNVENWDVSEYNAIYIVNNEKNANNDWQKLYRIYLVNTDTFVDLPNLKCVSEYGHWDKNKLITFSFDDDSTTQFCIWDDTGKLLYRYEYPAEWIIKDSSYVADGIGFASHQNNLFYINTKNDILRCTLHLFDLNNPDKFKVYSIPTGEKDIKTCKEINVDLDSLSLEKETFKFSLPH